MSLFRPARWIASLAIALAAILLMADVADARAGRGGGFGSRGARSFEPPPVTRTAPREAAPLQRQQDAGPATSQQAQAARAATAPRQGLAGRGGFFGGLLGAGLFGMLLGYGLFGGFGGLGSLLGLLLQVAIIGGVVLLVMRWLHGRLQPVPAGPAVPPLRRDAQDVRGSSAGAGGPGLRHRRRGGDDQIGIGQGDLDGFERILGELQTAYGRGDRATLRRLALPEVVGRLERDLDEDAARGVANRIDGVKLLQGDLAEAWREGQVDYATVAMRFELVDRVEELATGRVVEGDPRRPTEATEIWTFRRDDAGPWKVSAIQQA
ncbi:MAG TPA: TIM44-like domain-containing protein [Geminicoccaceae bacterium]|nr:TIM44-like domain-containing protein [Geminicoccus sp.]HMU53293.1 TIM44-like domain-containing protein [Geminicoccaceae bacterium]